MGRQGAGNSAAGDSPISSQPHNVASLREVLRQPPIEPTKPQPAAISELTLVQDTL